MRPTHGLGADGGAPRPPHSPTPRRTPEEPLTVLERVVADESSHVTDEETWDLYSQLEDEAAVAHTQWTLDARLAALEGGHVRFELPESGSRDVFTLSGRIREVGQGWCVVAAQNRRVIVNTSFISSVAVTSERQRTLTPPGGGAQRLGSWASVLRNSGASGRPLVIHRVVGSAIAGSLLCAAKDHVDIAQLEPLAPDHSPLPVTVPYAAVIRIELS